MSGQAFTAGDDIRTLFSQAMSAMYRLEVPQYATLLELVGEVNAATLSDDAAMGHRLTENDELHRLGEERHGAIRLGTPQELATMRRLFAVMGMAPVGYYDLSAAGVPVHSTAFRPVRDEALRRNPFRVFTSLLRLDLLADPALAAEAGDILARRSIFTPGCLSLIAQAERDGGLCDDHARRFVAEALETFRWQGQALVSGDVYRRLRQAHPLVADVVCFPRPHINHLTPRTLDIDAAQAAMLQRGLAVKAVIEGPPTRRVPILLRQTSFKALEEKVVFAGAEDGAHTARFGEIEQRGVALTPKGRALYDRLLGETQAEVRADEAHAAAFMATLAARFRDFPDDEDTLRREGLAHFRYVATGKTDAPPACGIETLIAQGHVRAEPIIYEDFLPVSAAGIFQSNLGGEARDARVDRSDLAAFEAALEAPVLDPAALYQEAQDRSRQAVLARLQGGAVSQGSGGWSPP